MNMSTIARLADCFHVVTESIELINELIASGLSAQRLPLYAKEDRGMSAFEVPEGLPDHSHK